MLPFPVGGFGLEPVMLKFTCGSTQSIDYDQFDGIVAGYHLNLGREPCALDIPNKIYRSQFLYGHKHHKPGEGWEHCETITEWVYQRVLKRPKINEWVLVNEFTDDLGVCYPDYKLDDLKRYCEAAHIANPKARLILGDFKPHLLRKWEQIAVICHELNREGFPVEVGVQTHIKTYNAPVILDRLPRVIKMFDCPVHLIEASLWYQNDVDRLLCNYFWGKLEGIADQPKVKSFCQWWLCSEDVEIGRRMPTFENLQLYVPN
jgi:hypothetical protein